MDVKTKTGQQSWQALLNGINRLTDCVAMTLGPAGRNIVVENTKWYYPTTTNDGATILQSIELPNPFENMGCKLLQQIADNTDEMVGDGTTTSAILARSCLLYTSYW